MFETSESGVVSVCAILEQSMLTLICMSLSLDRLFVIKVVLRVVRGLIVLIHGLMMINNIVMDLRLIYVQVVIFVIVMVRLLVMIIWVALVVAELSLTLTVGFR